jgi:flagella basal body P-ring formation protein FlgA
MIGDPVMFKKGKIVKIVCIHDTLNISTLGVAEEEGIFGTTVKVRNISSNKVIHGRVIGDSIVKVDI